MQPIETQAALPVDAQAQESAYWTPAGLAIHIDMSEKWVEKYTQARRIPGQKKMGGSWRYNKAAIEKALLSEQLLLAAPPKPGQKKAG